MFASNTFETAEIELLRKSSQKASKTTKNILMAQDKAFLINENNLNLYKVLCYVHDFDPSLSLPSLGYVCFPEKSE